MDRDEATAEIANLHRLAADFESRADDLAADRITSNVDISEARPENTWLVFEAFSETGTRSTEIEQAASRIALHPVELYYLSRLSHLKALRTAKQYVPQEAQHATVLNAYADFLSRQYPDYHGDQIPRLQARARKVDFDVHLRRARENAERLFDEVQTESTRNNLSALAESLHEIAYRLFESEVEGFGATLSEQTLLRAADTLGMLEPADSLEALSYRGSVAAIYLAAGDAEGFVPLFREVYKEFDARLEAFPLFDATYDEEMFRDREALVARFAEFLRISWRTTPFAAETQRRYRLQHEQLVHELQYARVWFESPEFAAYRAAKTDEARDQALERADAMIHEATRRYTWLLDEDLRELVAVVLRPPGELAGPFVWRAIDVRSLPRDAAGQPKAHHARSNFRRALIFEMLAARDDLSDVEWSNITDELESHVDVRYEAVKRIYLDTYKQVMNEKPGKGDSFRDFIVAVVMGDPTSLIEDEHVIYRISLAAFDPGYQELLEQYYMTDSGDAGSDLRSNASGRPIDFYRRREILSKETQSRSTGNRRAHGASSPR